MKVFLQYKNEILHKFYYDKLGTKKSHECTLTQNTIRPFHVRYAACGILINARQHLHVSANIEIFQKWSSSNELVHFHGFWTFNVRFFERSRAKRVENVIFSLQHTFGPNLTFQWAVSLKCYSPDSYAWGWENRIIYIWTKKKFD